MYNSHARTHTETRRKRKSERERPASVKKEREKESTLAHENRKSMLNESEYVNNNTDKAKRKLNINKIQNKECVVFIRISGYRQASITRKRRRHLFIWMKKRGTKTRAVSHRTESTLGENNDVKQMKESSVHDRGYTQ